LRKTVSRDDRMHASRHARALEHSSVDPDFAYSEGRLVAISGARVRSSSVTALGRGSWRRIRQLLGLLLRGRGGSAATMQTMVVRTLILGTNVLTGIVSARLLGTVGKGEQAAILMWSQLIPLCMTFGIPASLLFHVKSVPRDEGRLFGAALVLAVVIGIVAAAVGCVGLPYWLRHFDSRAVLCSQFLMLTVPYSLAYYAAIAIVEARAQFTLENLLALGTVLLTIVALFGLDLAGKVSSITVALAYALSGPPVGAVAIFYAVRAVRPQFGALTRSARTLLHFGVRYYIGDLFAVLLGFADQFLVTGFLAARMVGVYVVVASLCRMLSLVQQSIVVVLFPRIIGQPLDTIVDNVQLAARISIVISLTPALLIGIAGGELVQLIYGPGFMPGSAIIWLLLAESLLSGVARILSQAITSVGRPGAATVLNVVQFVVSVSLGLILLHRYSIVGVAAAMLTGTALRFVLTMAAYRIVLNVPMPRVTPSVSDLRFIYARLLSLTSSNVTSRN
jgi:O-antigen/teichoic acid export membrane protein